ncbi:hypothetical protein GCM10017772_28240 [Promicromonospora soli]|uniref:Uncharacterized protein n=1 Tax=Promicromonospora soli TaxID=2035533 RepID=A0A919FYU1_9MICO|nr:hypothetical protein GCM10017772_28240 [Promicromonospora soli]
MDTTAMTRPFGAAEIDSGAPHAFQGGPRLTPWTAGSVEVGTDVGAPGATPCPTPTLWAGPLPDAT